MGAGFAAFPGCRPDACSSCEALGLEAVDTLPHPSLLSQNLITAARDGDHVTVRVALAQGAYVDGRQPLKLLTMDRMHNGDPVRECGFTPLMYAAHNGNFLCVEALLAAKADVSSQDEEGSTILHLGASSGDLNTFHTILTAGADPHALDDNGLGVRDYIPHEVSTDPKEFAKWQKLLEAAEKGELPTANDGEIPNEGLSRQVQPTAQGLSAQAVSMDERLGY